MATFRITVRKHQKRRDGKYPISIRLTHRSKIAYIPTGYYAQQSDLTRSFELKNSVYGKTLNANIEKYEKLILELGRNIDRYGVHELAEYILKKVSIESQGIDFIKYARSLIAEMEKKGMKQPETYRYAVNNLEKFILSQNIGHLYATDITCDFLRKYESSIGGIRAPSAYISILRAIFNLACEKYNDEDKGIILIPNNPFKKYKVPSQNIARKRGLDSVSVRKIFDYKPVGVRDELARDMFFLSFCLAGTNAIDIFNCKSPIDGYLTYEREKTRDRRRSDRALIKIRIEPEIFSLIEKYKDETDERLFNLHRRFSNHKTFGASINKGLKIIGKTIGLPDLQFYAARHSWAGIARNECGIPKSEIHEYLNHVDPDLKVTDLYLQKDWKPLANANRKVLDSVNSAI
jgi:hypothetical protein